MFRRVADAVVAIEVPQGGGAGVLLSTGGLIATSEHLVEGWSTALILFRDGTRARGRVVRSFRRSDLAFVQLEEEQALRAAERVCCGLIEGRAPTARTPVVGETVYAIGHPLGLAFTLTRGIVSAVGREIGGRSYLQLDAAINPGNSGGPVYDAQARLVGITACSRAESQGLNFAVPAEEVYAKYNAYLEEREQGALHYCSVCGAASRDPLYCERCGTLLALVEAVEELGPVAGGSEPVVGPAEVGIAGSAGETEEGKGGPKAGKGGATAPAAVVCEDCGAENPPATPYCAVCGATL